ncbi:putative pumilio-like protein 7, chloroplastic [Dichanthelium oligosanthes]|uniref:Putative pumilio-like protein 7, chloroplastic n=1 Tax=Dichanthelium oligosanthes TaxID=888268 RepID=A0A1E5VTA6_9POAL|nr:putative pumilio-like protein 7, chloroplastic [Dichanthelium oligosanthes]
MKLDREMEMLLNEIPLLHHGGLLGGGEAGAGDDADFSYLIHELAAMGVVDGDHEPPAPAAAADGLGFAGFIYPKKGDHLVASCPFSMADYCAYMPSLFDPIPLDAAAAADGWDIRCSPAPSAPPPAATPRSRCKSARRKNGGGCGAVTTSPKKCGAAAAVGKPHGESLAGLRGFMNHVARDQHGCRFLQQRLDDGKREVDIIFAGVSRHAAQLMVDPFGNYLMQKLLAVCDAGQRMALVLTLAASPFALVRISLNVHGTRAVQKLIESLRTREEIGLVIDALRPGFLELIKDPNGNHVVQKCLQSFEADDNKAIFDAASVHCLDIGMQCHGCCVLQRCIARSRGEHREKLVAAIACNGFELAQDAYGNYVVQYVIDLKIPNANSSLAQQFEGKYIHLSMQKFSSNVVEKCLKVFKEADKAKIILELLSMPHLEQLLQHPYANYVIYSALQNSKGSLHSALTNAIRPHMELLRTSPYCKRIYSRALLKK